MRFALNLWRPLPAVLVVASIGLACAAESAPPDDATLNAPTPGMLLDVPVTTLIPGAAEIRPDIKSPVAEDSGAAARGMAYFASFNCSGCHADNGGGGMGPSLSNRQFIYGEAPENIYLSIAQGRPNGMPAWGKVLPDSAIWDLVAYIKSISNAPVSSWGTTTSLEAFKIEQVPAEFQSSPTPWDYTQPFSFGQNPGN